MDIENRRGIDRVSQVVEFLPSKCEALSSDPSATKKKKKNPVNKREAIRIHKTIQPTQLLPEVLLYISLKKRGDVLSGLLF
jgi:hypothetical protein